MVTSRRFAPPARQSRATTAGPEPREPRTRPRIGIWDLEVFAGFLPQILSSWNSCQRVFTFEMVDASVPRAISKGGHSTLDWASTMLAPRRLARDREHLLANIVADRVRPIAEDARARFRLDQLVLLTPDMIAFSEAGSAHYNYFSWSAGRIIIVSAYEVREFARQGGRRFEVALAAMILAQVIVAVQPHVGFHQEDRGCLFDFNESRVTLRDTFQQLRIEAACLATIDEPYRSAAERMLAVLRDDRG